MTHYLDLETALLVAQRATGADYGLLESALARPRSTVLGHDAYPTFYRKAAALLHSLAKNHCLIDAKPATGLARDRRVLPYQRLPGRGSRRCSL